MVARQPNGHGRVYVKSILSAAHTDISLVLNTLAEMRPRWRNAEVLDGRDDIVVRISDGW